MNQESTIGTKRARLSAYSTITDAEWMLHVKGNVCSHIRLPDITRLSLQNRSLEKWHKMALTLRSGLGTIPFQAWEL